MNPQDVLLQLLDENDHYIHDLLNHAPDDCLNWRADGQANSIAHLIWHVARAQDVFFWQHVRGQTAAEEIWAKNGWAERSGYTPTGAGTNGWGMLTGYSAEEVMAIPLMSRDILLGYYDAVGSAIRDYLATTDIPTLSAKAPGYNGQQTNWFWVRHPLFDMTRHVGEMLALKGQWERQSKAPGVAE
ncbi:MAG: DinB family protein [Anaerolineaceae bacterium]|nr:DinB family protein [Anaerolineaceae bacterium]